jgi:hypothetical protein
MYWTDKCTNQVAADLTRDKELDEPAAIQVGGQRGAPQ